MVAISLYRDSLRRVSNAPRRWRMPPQTLSFCEFKLLTRKRAEAVSRLATANPNFTNEETLKPEDKGVGGGDRDKFGTSTRQDWHPIDPQPSNFQPDDKEHTAEDRPLQESNVGASASVSTAGASAAMEEDVRDSRPGGGACKIDGHLEVRRCA